MSGGYGGVGPTATSLAHAAENSELGHASLLRLGAKTVRANQLRRLHALLQHAARLRCRGSEP